MFTSELLSGLVRRFVARSPERRARLERRRLLRPEMEWLEGRRLFSNAASSYPVDGYGEITDFPDAVASESPGPGDDDQISQGSADDGTDCEGCPPIELTECGDCPTDEYTSDPIRYSSGQPSLTSVDLMSNGFGKSWGHVRSWMKEYSGVNGHGWVLKDQPHIVELVAGATMVIVGSGTEQRWFDKPDDVWVPRGAAQDTLTQGTDELIYVDSSGNKTIFFDYSSGNDGKKGQIKSFTDADGSGITFVYDGGDLETATRSYTSGTVTVKEQLAYAYLESPDVNAGKLSTVTLQRKTYDTSLSQDDNNTSYTTVRSVQYTYYDGDTNDDKGLLGDLQTATIRDSVGATIDVNYYRYYVSNSLPGFVGGIKYVFGGESYARAAAALSSGTVLNAADGDIDQFADNYFEYNADHRVTKEIAQGAGCSSCTGGQGTFTYAYTTNTNVGYADAYGNWKTKTVETLPDNNTRTVYTNYVGKVILTVTKNAGGDAWGRFYKYDVDGRQLWVASPSALDLPSNLNDLDQYNDVLQDVSGNFYYMHDGQGAIYTTSYYGGTTATSSVAGGVEGYVYQKHIQRGETGTGVLQSTQEYIERTAGGITTYPRANQTVYRTAGGADAQTTSFAYTWFGSTHQPESVTVTLPTVTTAQNGPNAAVTTTTFFDSQGRTIWSRVNDGAGLENFFNYIEYDVATGAIVKMIQDVNASSVGNEPSGWTTPSGGGLHLTTTMVVDSLGRTTKLTDPKGNLTYTIYKDAQHEVRTYRGWTGTATTGPIEISRQVRPSANSQKLVYNESLTTSIAASHSSSVPTGTETPTEATIQTLYRSFTNDSGQTLWTDSYHSTSGLVGSWYTPDVAMVSNEPDDIGTEGTNYYRTRVGYDDRGRQNMVKNAVGTITRTVYDVLGREVSAWVGTDDTGAGNYDPDGSGGANNMKQVAAYEYDSGNDGGDSNLTKLTAMPQPGTSSADRVTQYAYDWRNRLVATKGGVQGSESTGDNSHPIVYCVLDNLGQQTSCTTYDGDTLSITTDGNSDGVPDAPSSSARRAYVENDFDEWGRVYESRVFGVAIASGNLTANSLKTKTWFDKRGNAIKTSQPGGLVGKSQIDGAGRLTKSFVTDGGGDSAWSDADDVSGDKVLEQVAYTYDANGNVILTTAKQRFHDETGTGELGDASTTPKARVSYMASYYDVIDRVTESVDVGTNAGSSYTRPGSAPSRSDTVLVTSYSYDSAGRLLEVSDPKALETRYGYDLLGRTLSVTENYINGTPGDSAVGDADDRKTVYTYDGNGNVLTMTADMPSGTDDQVTQYVYGVTTGGGNDINSNDLLKEVRYPDASTGAASSSSSDKEQYTYNALGQVKTMTDQNQSVHTYTYDVLGRLTSDEVTTLGSGVDGTVRRQEVRYNTQGLADQFTQRGLTQSVSTLTRSGTTATATITAHGYAAGDTVVIAGANQAQYNGTFVITGVTANTFTYTMASDPGASGTGTITARRLVNQVEREFNDLGQMKTEYQQINGAVNTGTSLKVQYAYTEMASGANHSRLKTMTYPNGRILRYEYTSGLDADISRVSYLADDSSGSVGTHLEEYSYLGLSTIVERKHPEPNLDLSFVKQTAEGTGDAGDQYTGLDRFGRVVDQRWFDRRASGQTDDRETDRFRYAYDRNSNRVSREWDSYSMPSTFKGDEAYFYDDLNRLNKANRGTLASGTITDANATWAQQWDNTGSTGSEMDALGNWTAVTTDTNGGTAGSATTQTRTHNDQNQIATVSGATSPTYDDAGSMTKDETGVQYTYDAWGRTIKVKTSGGTDKVTYTLDALGRRVAQDVTSSGVGSDTQYYHSANWQIVEEREYNGSSYAAKWQNVWGLAYIDQLAVRDTIDPIAAGALDTSFSGDGKYTHSLGSVDIARAVQQADGKVVAIGDVGGNVGLARFNADGTLDTAFDGNGGSGNGFFTTDFGGTDQGLGVTIDNNGKIVVVGYTSNGSDLLIARYNGSDGVLDTSFDTDGKKIIDIAGLTGSASDVYVQTDGKIVIAGTNGGDMLIGRLNDDGSWDTSFNTTGYLKVNFGGTDRGLQMAIDHDGKYVVVGDTTTGTGGDFTVIRVTTAGALDTSFDTDGKQTTSFSAGQDGARGVAIDSQNRIVVGGQGGGDFRIARYTTAGALDTSFDTDGMQSVSINGTDDGEDLVLDNAGRILISGSINGDKDFGIARLTSAGALDTSFDSDGKQTIDFAGGTTAEECETMLVQPDGKIFLAGTSGSDFAVARLSGGGARHYIVQDANYNVTAVVEAGATVADRYQYTPYGVITTLNADFSTDLDGSGEVYQAFYFQGLRFDGNSQNHHARNRDYRASLGRWTQNDPAGYVDGANRYAFVDTSPLANLDAWGLQAESTTKPATGPATKSAAPPSLPAPPRIEDRSFTDLIYDLNDPDFRVRVPAENELRRRYDQDPSEMNALDRSTLTPNQQLVVDTVCVSTEFLKEKLMEARERMAQLEAIENEALNKILDRPGARDEGDIRTEKEMKELNNLRDFIAPKKQIEKRSIDHLEERIRTRTKSR